MQKSLIIKRFIFCCIILLLANLQSNAEDVVRFTPELQKAALKYSRILPFQDGLAPAKRDGKWGFINTAGKEVISCKYDELPYFSRQDTYFKNGLISVKKNGKWGVLNTKGEEVVPFQYDEKELAVVESNRKYGFINTEGEDVDINVIHAKYDYVSDFYEGLATVEKNGKYGFINTKGEEVLPCQFDYANNFHEGLAVVKRNDKYGFINSKGEVVIPFEYDYASDFYNGFAPVERNDYWGAINTEGKLIIPFEYDESVHVPLFSEGLAAVRTGDWETGKYGFINTKGEKVIPYKYDYAFCFQEGLAPVRIGDWETGKYGVINTRGEVIIPFKYDEVGYTISHEWFNEDLGFSQGLVCALKNGKWGFINKRDEVIVPFVYDGPEQFCHGYAQVCRGGKHALLNIYAEELICGTMDIYMPSFYGTWNADLQDGIFITLVIDKDQITEIVKKHGRVVSKSTKSYTIDYEYSEDDSFWDTNFYYDYIYFIITDNSKYKIFYNDIYGMDDCKFEREKNTKGKTKR